jgi:NAD(P)-dependent dehydrogenase (short-subunit alcohol dehydrogenase family)
MKNKVILITGATSGIGKATAFKFGQAGAKVVVSGRRQSEGQSVVEAIKAEGGEAIFVRADVTIEDDVKALVSKTVETYGRLDVAFNNAGVEHVAPISEVTRGDYQRLFDINVWGVTNSMQHEIAAMQKTGGGSIINTSSIGGHVGMAGLSIYIASKHAVEGLTKTTALEYAKEGIRVNAVAPGAIDTDMVTRFAGEEGSEMRAGLASMHPVGRMGRDTEIADAVLFLASDAASFITGTSLKVDGGFLAQ